MLKLLFLPSLRLKTKYEEFFLKNNQEINPDFFHISTPGQNFWQYVPGKNPHMFFDEYCATSAIDDYFNSQFQELMKRKLNPESKKENTGIKTILQLYWFQIIQMC